MTSTQRLLIIEDEAAIRTGLVDVFVFHGFTVDSAANGTEGLQKALSGQFDLILLDIMLPGINGYDICNAIREQDRKQAIIMLTAKTSDEEIIQGLTLGADDYVAKPFSIAELVLRVKAVLRRGVGSADDGATLLFADGLTIDMLNHCGQRHSEALTFTRREIDLLSYLARHSERPVSRAELLTKVWGYARHLDIETRTVDIHIAKLRRKIETDPKEPVNLVTVRGAGYRLLHRAQ
ncbi:MAG: response regulator transcription factor [Woeseia sp.]